IRRLSILRAQGGPGGADLEVGVVGENVDLLRQQAERVSSYVKTIPGVYDVRHDMEAGKLEYQYMLNEHGRQLGLTQQQLANAVRTGFLGLEVTQVNWRDKSIPVRLIYPEAIREGSMPLTSLPITLNDGRVVYLGEVATVEKGRGYNSISRRDLERLATITADVDDKITTPDQVIERIGNEFAAFSDEMPGYRLMFLGQKKEAAESMAGMKQAGLIALVLIFFILSALFRSLLDPLVVMFAIPFGLIGVIIGHVLFGLHLQFLSLIGFLALSGIVVNDSLILVEFARRMRCEGMDRLDALVEAGRVRIRPIMLTTITTFLGVSPLIFFSSGQTAFLSPMAISLGFGLLFATGLILVALPCFYLIADDMRCLSYRAFGKTY
ncbi:efflux RND transporter permease subunit, partial [Solemya elarraichensis gill symbiont]